MNLSQGAIALLNQLSAELAGNLETELGTHLAAVETAAKTKTLTLSLGDVSGTGAWNIRVPVAGTVTRVSLLSGATAAANDTNYWTGGVVNKGAAGDGTAKVVDSTVAVNSTKATGGAAITASVERTFTLAAANTVAANDVLEITITKAASATTLTKVSVSIDVTIG